MSTNTVSKGCHALQEGEVPGHAYTGTMIAEASAVVRPEARTPSEKSVRENIESRSTVWPRSKCLLKFTINCLRLIEASC